MSLEDRRAVAQAKWLHQVPPVPVSGNEGCPPLVRFSDVHQTVGAARVQFSKVTGLGEGVECSREQREGMAILDG